MRSRNLHWGSRMDFVNSWSICLADGIIWDNGKRLLLVRSWFRRNQIVHVIDANCSGCLSVSSTNLASSKKFENFFDSGCTRQIGNIKSLFLPYTLGSYRYEIYLWWDGWYIFEIYNILFTRGMVASNYSYSWKLLETVVLDFNYFPFLITISWAYFELTNKFSPNHSNDPQKN